MTFLAILGLVASFIAIFVFFWAAFVAIAYAIGEESPVAAVVAILFGLISLFSLAVTVWQPLYWTGIVA